MAVSLDDLIPRTSEFELESTGEKYTLRKFSIEDKIWLKRTFGDEVEAIFKDLRIAELAQIAWHLMMPESKRKFLKQKIMTVNDDGDEVEIEIGGLKMFRLCIQGLGEEVKVMQAIVETIGLNQEVLSEMVSMEEDSKKKAVAQESTIGDKPSTP